jgi:hypothetical protein
MFLGSRDKGYHQGDDAWLGSFTFGNQIFVIMDHPQHMEAHLTPSPSTVLILLFIGVLIATFFRCFLQAFYHVSLALSDSTPSLCMTRYTPK